MSHKYTRPARDESGPRVVKVLDTVTIPTAVEPAAPIELVTPAPIEPAQMATPIREYTSTDLPVAGSGKYWVDGWLVDFLSDTECHISRIASRPDDAVLARHGIYRVLSSAERIGSTLTLVVVPTRGESTEDEGSSLTSDPAVPQ